MKQSYSKYDNRKVTLIRDPQLHRLFYRNYSLIQFNPSSKIDRVCVDGWLGRRLA